MPNITIRNIPESIFRKLRLMSQKEKRSLNNEILCVIERGLAGIDDENGKHNVPLNKEGQIAIWKELSGKWEDKRSTKKIIQDIYEARTLGRDIEI